MDDDRVGSAAFKKKLALSPKSYYFDRSLYANCVERDRNSLKVSAEGIDKPGYITNFSQFCAINLAFLDVGAEEASVNYNCLREVLEMQAQTKAA